MRRDILHVVVVFYSYRCAPVAETIDAKLLGDSLPKTNPWDNGIGYAMATTLLRLPGYAPMLAFNHIVDVPLIVPHAKLSQEAVCTTIFSNWLFVSCSVIFLFSLSTVSLVIAVHIALCRNCCYTALCRG